MASNVTLGELRAQARATADMQNSGFVTPAELDQYINLATKTLYDLLVSRFEDYYIAGPTTFTVTAPNNSYNLPADFYKCRAVDTQNAGQQWAPMTPFNFQNRNMLQNPLLYPNYALGVGQYRIMGNKLLLLGAVEGTFTGRLWYIPACPKLVNESDTFDGVNGWERHIIVATAIMMKQKEESDVSVLMAEIEKIEDRIRSMANDRDAGSPERVTDVTYNEYGPFPRF
jgi:hypothetical protein